MTEEEIIKHNNAKLQVAIKVLKQIPPNYLAYICIAGGFMRDYILKRPIGDIDIFILPTGGIIRWLVLESKLVQQEIVDATYESTVNYDLIGKSTIEGVKVQFIEVNSEFSISDFDIGLSQVAWWPSDGQLEYTDYFKRSINEKLFIHFPKNGGYQVYFKKIRDKYKDYDPQSYSRDLLTAEKLMTHLVPFISIGELNVKN